MGYDVSSPLLNPYSSVCSTRLNVSLAVLSNYELVCMELNFHLVPSAAARHVYGGAGVLGDEDDECARGGKGGVHGYSGNVTRGGMLCTV
jgi:hypothetical protein